MRHSAFVLPQTFFYSSKPVSCNLCHKMSGNSFVSIHNRRTSTNTLFFGQVMHSGTHSVLPTSIPRWTAQQELEEEQVSMEKDVSQVTESSQDTASPSDNGAVFEEPLMTESTQEELEPRPYFKLYMEQKQLEKQFQRHERDTGSPQVQIARLTARINHLTEHAKEHKHDYAAIRGLIGLVNKRKRLLKYLRRYGDEQVIQLAKQLNIRVSKELVESRK
ncbi:hypothetical protein GpartN1_g7560.t1 [Galdieria partita]|uniref:30S ribosomal protein S15 n=1 Tax=Galdieria partita TaxID=83374 RepID=A0A9C7Q4X5_9RHOD|nr:hypothetical protein GpartN1_g7560.t1 [Galdieria partita]